MGSWAMVTGRNSGALLPTVAHTEGYERGLLQHLEACCILAESAIQRQNLPQKYYASMHKARET